MNEGLLSVPQLAARLGLNRSSVHRRVVDGSIEPSTMVGNRALFTPERAAEIVAAVNGARPNRGSHTSVPTAAPGE